MKNVLITGATGNIGSAVIRYLLKSAPGIRPVAAVRNMDKARKLIPDAPHLVCTRFDFTDSTSFPTAFRGIDLLFLLRPPELSRVRKTFYPLLEAAADSGIENVVFLSVQGAEKSNVIPHRKIEKRIEEMGFNHVFVRPSYFMQNLTTTLLPEILNHRTVTLPAGDALFNWVDVENIAESTAVLIANFNKYQNKAFDLTGAENKSFSDVTALMTHITGVDISYRSTNPVYFFLHKRRQGVSVGFAAVLTMLHFLPRLQGPPEISDTYQKLTGKVPTSLATFIEREKALLKGTGINP